MDEKIEELANDLQEAWTAWSLSKDLKTPYAFVAEILAKKWQPKMHQGVVDYIENYKQGFKEGVEAVRIQLKEVNLEFQLVGNKYSQADIKAAVNGFYKAFMQKLDEICKELVDE